MRSGFKEGPRISWLNLSIHTIFFGRELSLKHMIDSISNQPIAFPVFGVELSEIV
jgi:hypothetical protein